MNISKSGLGKMNEIISLVGANIIDLKPIDKVHHFAVNDIREQGWYINVEGRGLKRRTIDVEDVRDQIVQYAQEKIKDDKQVLALIVYICIWWVKSVEKSSPTFIHARPLVELLGYMKSPCYRGALLIYQAALFERETVYGAHDVLLRLPVVELDLDDNYHAISAWMKACVYRSNGKYIEASKVLGEIGVCDPKAYQLAAKNEIDEIAPFAKKQEEEEACTIL